MAELSFTNLPRYRYGTESAISATAVSNGQILVDTTNGVMYTDLNNTRINLGGILSVANSAALPSANIQQKVYLDKSTGDLYYYVNSNWNKINGAEAVTSIAWDSVTGKPETFTPATHSHAGSDITDLDTIISGAVSGKMNEVAGGSAGQVLQKTSSGYGWTNLPSSAAVDSSVVSGSTNPVAGGAVYESIQDVLQAIGPEVTSAIGADGAQSGQVMTADGEGGFSWQNPSAGPLVLNAPYSENAIHLVLQSSSTPNGTYTTVYDSRNSSSIVKYFDGSGFVAMTSSGIPAYYVGKSVIVDVSGILSYGQYYRFKWVAADTVVTTQDTDWFGGYYPADGADQVQIIYERLGIIDQSKLNAPVSAGTSGQVLGLDAELNPTWVTVPAGGSSTPVDLSDYYTSSQVNELLGSKADASTLSNYITSGGVSGAIDSALDGYYTSSQVDGLLSSKVTSGGVSSMIVSSLGGYYTSSAVNGLVSSKLDAPVSSGVSGAVLTLDSALHPIWAVPESEAAFVLVASKYEMEPYGEDHGSLIGTDEIEFNPTGQTNNNLPVYSATIGGSAFYLANADTANDGEMWFVAESLECNGWLEAMWGLSGTTPLSGGEVFSPGQNGWYYGAASGYGYGDATLSAGAASVDMSLYYTSAQVNTLLSSKANASELQTVSALANSKIDSAYLTTNNYITSGGVSSMVTSSLGSYYNSATVSGMLNSKLNTPATSGTSGQVLALNSNLQPVWVDATPSGGSSSSSSPSNGGYTLTAPLYDRPADEDESTQVGTVTIDFAPIDETDQVAAGGPNENDEYTYVERPVYSGTYNNTTLYLHCVWDNDAFDNAWIITESKDTTDIASAWWTLSGYSPLQETNTFDIGSYGTDMHVGTATLTSNGNGGSSSGSTADLSAYYTSSQVDTLLSSKIATSAIGVSNGVAGLNASGVIPDGQIPKAAINVFGGVMLQSAGGLKIPTSGTSSGHLMLDPATSNQITSRSGSYRPITPATLNNAVLGALTDAKHITMDSTQQATARGVIGAVDSSTVSGLDTRLTALENNGGGASIDFNIVNDTSVTPNTHTVTISAGNVSSSFVVSDGQNGSNGTGGGSGTTGGPASVLVTSGATLTLSPNSPAVIDWAPYVSSAGASGGNSGPGFAFTFKRYDMSDFEETNEQGPEIASGVINFTPTGQTTHVTTGPVEEGSGETETFVDKPVYSGTYNGQTFYMVYIWDEGQWSNQWIIGTNSNPESYYDGYWAMSSDPADGMQVYCTETAYYEGYGDGVFAATAGNGPSISYDGTLVLGSGWESGKEYYYKVNFVVSSGAVLTLGSGLAFNNNQGTADAVETGMTNEMLVSIRNAGGIVTVLNARRES